MFEMVWVSAHMRRQLKSVWSLSAWRDVTRESKNIGRACSVGLAACVLSMPRCTSRESRPDDRTGLATGPTWAPILQSTTQPQYLLAYIYLSTPMSLQYTISFFITSHYLAAPLTCHQITIIHVYNLPSHFWQILRLAIHNLQAILKDSFG